MGTPIESFVSQVREYCAFIERAGSMSLAERLSAARLQLLKVYTAALDLPTDAECGDVDAGSDPQQPQNWPGFDEVELYWDVYDPYEQDDPVGGSLSDDLLDVYRDLKRGLALWDAAHPTEAIWEWRFHLNAHWGDHAVDALRALHRACARIAPSRSTKPEHE